MDRGRILVIEEGLKPGEAELKAVLRNDLGFRCDSLPWSAFRCDIPCPEADLILPFALFDVSRLEFWKAHVDAVAAESPALVVLPLDVDRRSIQHAVQTADDFVLWPARRAELLQRMNRLLDPSDEIDSARENLTRELGLLRLVGKDPNFVRIVNTLPRIASSDCFVLITGETGTGKELFAQAIHHLGKRSRFPFIPVDCGAVPAELLANELWGHAAGAYTDARRDQQGLAAMAEGGTLFLDEVDALSTAAQAKLLRFLQDRAYKRLGETRFRQANVNVVTASNQDLDALVKEGSFRSDLYFRLSVLRIHLPPLRERRTDIHRLCRHHLKALGAEKAISNSALLKLTTHNWPGNVRELFNVVQRAVVVSDGTAILPQHILFSESRQFPSAPPAFGEAKAQVLADFERAYVEELLKRNGGNVTRAAREARKERRSFGRLVKKYGLDASKLRGRG